MNKDKLDKIKAYTLHLDNLDSLSPSNDEDREIIEQSKKATNYLLSHPWCVGIKNGWLGISWDYMVCVFLYEIDSDNPEVDQFIWMIVGDLPSAYIDIESASNSEEALRCYVDIMGEWVNAIENGASTEACYPLEVPATSEYAQMLKGRLELIEEELAA